ncbi:MAG: BspA family leucine-rich repeat surface protein [Bacteroidetes bacterium]|nr:MAG: BspA family leucine-rich repeat surface protein [Bacteroidota bacterium]
MRYGGDDDNFDLAKYDGTTLTIIPSPAGYQNSYYGYIGDPIVVGSTLYMQYNGNDDNFDLAKYDGTTFTFIPSPAGYDNGSRGYQGSPIVVGSTLYMRYLDNDTNFDLAKYDGTTLTFIPSPAGYQNSYYGYQGSPIVVGSTLYMRYFGNDDNFDLAKYDGTTLTMIPSPAGYQDVYRGYYDNPIVVGSILYIRYLGNYGNPDLAKYDGTTLTFIPSLAGYENVGYGYQGTPIVVGSTLYMRYRGNDNNYDLIKLVSPEITLSTTTLSGAFSNTATNSTAQTFTASGTDLGVDVSFALSTTDWELSTNNVTFSPTLALTQSSGSLIGQPVTVYVRLKQGLTSGMKIATLTASSAGATNKTITLTGTANAFVTTWVTTDNTITILTNGGGYNYSVVWTNPTTGVAGNATGLANNYTITGLTNNETYQVAITGAFPQFYMDYNATERTKIKTIAQWGNIAWISMNSAFKGCDALTYTATDVPNLSGVIDMSDMFRNCTNFNGNIGGWNTSTITNMYAMFTNCTNFNGNIGSWNTSAVTSMTFIFTNCTNFNQNIGSWNTSAVTGMGYVFYNATSFNQNIGSWQLNSNVILANMLDNCGMNVANYDATLAGWATQAVTGRTLGSLGRQYCNITDRNILINSLRNWTIIGDALSGSCPTPEINLTGNSVSIVDGDTSPSTTDHTDFGTTGVGGTIARTFTIQNTGTGVLNITSVVSSNPTKFVISGAPATVAAGSSATFVVTYSPTLAMTDNATLTVNNNDADEAMYDFAITGKSINALPTDVRGNMISFDGLNDNVNIPHNSLYDGTNALTLEAWVYKVNTNGVAMIHKWKTNQFTLEIYFDKLTFVLGGGQGSISSSNNFPLNQWVHCVGVFNGTQMLIYENGVLTGSKAASGTIPTDAFAYDMTIGSRSETPAGYFQGNIDEVRIWNTARTQAQIRESMHLTLAGTESGLVAYYQFNEASGNAIDAVAGNNGTLNGGVSRVASDLAVARGASTRQGVTAGMNNFTNANVSINFTIAPADEFVAYQLCGNPFNGVNALNAGTNTTSCYWIVRQFGTGGVAYNGINFTIPSSNTISMADVTTPSNLRLHKRPDNSTSAFPNFFATATSANNTTKVIQFTGLTQTSFSQFEISSTSSPLPVTLLSFEGKRKDENNIILEWKTAIEVNNKGFEIETSKNLTEFTTIGFVDGKGNTNNVNNYQFESKNKEDIYYRLKQIDFNGSFSYSNIIFIKGNEDIIKIYPNPTTANININVDNWKNGNKTTFELFDLQGKSIVKESIKANRTILNTENLQKGIYILEIIQNTKRTTHKIVVQ